VLRGAGAVTHSEKVTGGVSTEPAAMRSQRRFTMCRASLRLAILLAVAALFRAQGCASISHSTFGLNEANGQANITVTLTADSTSTLRGYTFQLDLPADGTITVTRTRSALRLSTLPAVGPVTTTWALQPLGRVKLTFYLRMTHWPNNVTLSLDNGTSGGAAGACLVQSPLRITAASTCSPTPVPTRAPTENTIGVGPKTAAFARYRTRALGRDRRIGCCRLLLFVALRLNVRARLYSDQAYGHDSAA
jgi:uncharacterized protein YceK